MDRAGIAYGLDDDDHDGRSESTHTIALLGNLPLGVERREQCLVARHRRRQLLDGHDDHLKHQFNDEHHGQSGDHHDAEPVSLQHDHHGGPVDFDDHQHHAVAVPLRLSDLLRHDGRRMHDDGLRQRNRHAAGSLHDQHDDQFNHVQHDDHAGLRLRHDDDQHDALPGLYLGLHAARLGEHGRLLPAGARLPATAGPVQHLRPGQYRLLLARAAAAAVPSGMLRADSAGTVSVVVDQRTMVARHRQRRRVRRPLRRRLPVRAAEPAR